MTNWGKYWESINHTPKALCSWHHEIDSFKLFKIPELVRLVKESVDKQSFFIPDHSLVATLLDNGSLSVTYNNGSYIIQVEKKPCNYGGYYYFFHCPLCTQRMRKLYCIRGQFQCRKCGKLGYYSQRVRPTYRCLAMARKIKKYLQDKAGDIDRKPPWMKRKTFKILQRRHYEYYNGDKAMNASLKEFLQYYPHQRNHIDKIKKFFVL